MAPANTRRTSTSADHHAEVLDRARELLARHQRRSTRAVRRLVAALAEAPRPLTVQELGDLTGLPISSVYRNVAALTAAGVLDVVRSAERTDHFELSELVGNEHHHHLICAACGLVEDYRTPVTMETQVDSMGAAIASERGWQLLRHTLDLIGMCSTCATVTPPHDA